MQTVQSNKKLILLLLIVISSIVLILQQQTDEDTSREEQTNGRVYNMNPDILPSIRTVSDIVHSQAISHDGEFSYNNKIITLINGYPSAVDIGVIANLAEGSYDVDKTSAESALIINGDCLIIYTEAKTGMPPKIIDLFSTCK